MIAWSLLLQDARHAAEAEIYTSLNAKIDQFLQLADYNWLAAVQGGGTLTASDYLIDLIAFLNSTFAVFTNLPVSIHNTHTHGQNNLTNIPQNRPIILIIIIMYLLYINLESVCVSVSVSTVCPHDSVNVRMCLDVCKLTQQSLCILAWDLTGQDNLL